LSYFALGNPTSLNRAEAWRQTGVNTAQRNLHLYKNGNTLQ